MEARATALGDGGGESGGSHWSGAHMAAISSSGGNGRGNRDRRNPSHLIPCKQ
jgi:hypothetical protein